VSVRLDDAEIWAELSSAHTGILTTLRADGAPVALPVWFVALDRRIYVSGPARTHKFARIRRDPRCSFLVESGERWSELRAVHLSGVAAIVADAELLDRVGAALDEKYRGFRTSRSAMPTGTREHYSVERATVEIVPAGRPISWDNSRLRLDA